MQWSRHRHAPWYLAGLSFTESSFFPIPPDVMLAPMSLANPARAWWFALITTVASVAGGLFGYAIGYFAFDLVEPFIRDSRYWDGYLLAQVWFDNWGFWAVFLAATFSPIPYKIFTIASGVMAMTLFPFFVASLLGRGSRFFLVAGLMKLGGPRMDGLLQRYAEWLGWITVAIIAAVVLMFGFA